MRINGLFLGGALLLVAPHISFAQQSAPAEVVLKQTGAGWMMTDVQGMTLYTFDRDQPNKSTCNAQSATPTNARAARNAASASGGCMRTWPPLLAKSDAQPVGDWSPIAREDGTKQWAWHGKPLYTYIKDKYPGATVGDDFQLIWHVAFQPVDLPPGIRVFSDITGAKILTDVKGMTLYARDSDSAEGKPCGGSCGDRWQPAGAAWAAKSFGDWTTIARTGGIKQWAYKGKPLYSFDGDINAGDMLGDGVDKAWHAVALDPGPGFPSWVTIRKSDYGVILADSQGMTLYGFTGNLESVKQKTCNDECLRASMRPVPAAGDMKPVGNWSVIPGQDGAKVWAYKGELVYTFAGDKKPGDIQGDKFASGSGGSGYDAGGWWRPLMRSCLCSPNDAGG